LAYNLTKPYKTTAGRIDFSGCFLPSGIEPFKDAKKRYRVQPEGLGAKRNTV
jgi:hypothetical protein